MKIIAVETHLIGVPFSMGAAPAEFVGFSWSKMFSLFLRIVTDAGLEGWGEGFGHACCPATRSVMDTQLAPALLGQDARDITGLHRRIGHAFHLFGRNGPHLYAQSAMDMALWDIAGKQAGLPLWRLLGATPPATFPAYASLLRYGAPGPIAAAVSRAVDQGYGALKLHEITVGPVAAAREAAGEAPSIMVDTNCPWTPDEAIDMARQLRPYNLHGSRSRCGRRRISTASPVCAARAASRSPPARTPRPDRFRPCLRRGGARHRPTLASPRSAASRRCCGSPGWRRQWVFGSMPHCAYFGAGFLASLHLHARLAPDQPFERLFVDLEASPYHDMVEAKSTAASRCRRDPASAAIPIRTSCRASRFRLPTSTGPEAMKITALRTAIVHLPIDPPIRTAIFEIRSADCVLVFLDTDQGIIGEGLVFTHQQPPPVGDPRHGAHPRAAGRWPRSDAAGRVPPRAPGPSSISSARTAFRSSASPRSTTRCGTSAARPADLNVARLLGAFATAVPTYASGGLWLSLSIDELQREASRLRRPGLPRHEDPGRQHRPRRQRRPRARRARGDRP